MPILRLRGSTALSAFRRAKLDTALKNLHPSLAVAASEFWHFVELEREPDAAGRRCSSGFSATATLRASHRAIPRSTW